MNMLKAGNMIYKGMSLNKITAKLDPQTVINNNSRITNSFNRLKSDLVNETFNYLLNPASKSSDHHINQFQNDIIRANEKKQPIFINFNKDAFSVITSSNKYLHNANFCHEILTLRNGVNPALATANDLVFIQRDFEPMNVFDDLSTFDEYDFLKWDFSSIFITRKIESAYHQSIDLSDCTYIDPRVFEVLSRSIY